MGELFSNFSADLATSPEWVQGWLNVLGPVLIITLVVFMFRRNLIPAAILILLGIISTFVLYANFGYERILGLGHVAFWTPAMLYMWKVRRTWNVGSSIVGRWIPTALIFMFVSLVFDYYDVIRWFMGDTAI